jgi:hypothetical protein
MSNELFWPLEFDFHQTCRTLFQTCSGFNPICQPREISSMSGLSHFGVTLLVWPVWWTSLTGLLWQLQRLVFLDSYKRHLTLSLMGCWCLTICITFQQPLELSPTTLCEMSFVEDSWFEWRVLCMSTWVQAMSTLDRVKHPWIICYSWRWTS